MSEREDGRVWIFGRRRQICGFSGGEISWRGLAVWAVLMSVLTFFGVGLYGCIVSQTLELIRPEGPPDYNEIASSYRQTEIRQSTAAEVLNYVNMTDYELLSQSKNVIASSGDKKDGHKIWFNMFAFDEEELAVQRKYLFIVDEKVKTLFRQPWEGFWFDCSMVIPAEILDKPYANENARRIAVLESILENIRADIDQVGSDNKMVSISGMLINQVFQTVRTKLDASPATAVKLDQEKGLVFDHVNMDKGSINMSLSEDVATVQVRVGSLYQTVPLWYRDRLPDAETP